MVNGVFLVGGEVFGQPLHQSFYIEQPFMLFVEFFDDGAICPSKNSFFE